MMTIKPWKILLLLLLLWRTGGEILAQQKDFQTWWEFSLDKGLDNGIDLSGEVEQRFRNNSLQYDRTLVTLSAAYELMDYLEVAGGFRAVVVSNRELQLRTKYRMHMDATGKYTLSGFDLSLRARLQYGFEDLFYSGIPGSNNLVNRFRGKVAYHIFGTRLDWFATVESWHLYSNVPGALFYKMRYSAGVQFTPNFRSRFTLRYILEDEFNVKNPLQSHVLVLGYNYKL